ncbi:MAG: hypothetical protein OEV33_01680, partial [Armatimonadota bacterium]|nr:hypothetical protein [Armatimonadota bacterium]
AARGSGASEGPADSRLQSYQYVRAEPVHPPASGDSSAAKPRGTPPTDRSEAIRHGVLLVCWHHDTGSLGSSRRVLVAYEDGSVKWQRAPDFLAAKKAPARSPQPGKNDW